MTVLDTTALENLPPFLRTPEVAKLMRKTENAVVQDRYLGLGPPYIRDGRRILYDRDQVIEYLRQRTVQPDDPRPAVQPDDPRPAASAPVTKIAQPVRSDSFTPLRT